MSSRRFPLCFAAVALVLAVMFSTLASTSAQQATAPPQSPNPDGWQIPPGAADEVNALPGSADVLARGARVYASKCERCHGPTGKGDGPDADSDHPPDDLTDAGRARRNPDGVMFYKVWNGRRAPKMPSYKDELSRDDVWAVVHYAKSLRQPAP